MAAVNSPVYRDEPSCKVLFDNGCKPAFKFEAQYYKEGCKYLTCIHIFPLSCRLTNAQSFIASKSRHACGALD